MVKAAVKSFIGKVQAKRFQVQVGKNVYIGKHCALKGKSKIVTIENHSIYGGLGSAVCDVLSEKAPTKVLKIGINDTYGESGPAVELVKKYGLDAESIYKKIKEF